MDQVYENLRDNGYVVVPDVFSVEEVTRCREAIDRYLRVNSNHYVSSNHGISIPDVFGYIEELRFLLTHQKLLTTIRQACGPQAQLMPHHDLQVDRTSSWHKDTRDEVEDPWQVGPDGEPFQVYKCGIYPASCPADYHGITIRKGSHQCRELHHGDVIGLSARATDVVIFDQRISHCGRRSSIPEKVIRRLVLKDQTWQTRICRVYRRFTGAGNRIGLFLSAGVPCDLTTQFAHNTILRQLRKNAEDPDIIDALSEAFATIREPRGNRHEMLSTTTGQTADSVLC